VPESIRNAIVVAFIAVLMAMVGVGLLAWSRRPAGPPPRKSVDLPLLVNDAEGGVSDLSVRLQQLERKQGEGQVLNQRLMEQLQAANADRDRLNSRIAGLEKEVRSMRRRLVDAEQRLPPRPRPATPPVQSPSPVEPVPPAGTSTPNENKTPPAF